MATYPGAIYLPRAKENKSGVVYDATKKTVIFVEDVTFLDAEVVAIETELGTNPKGGFADVKTRLEALVPYTGASQNIILPDNIKLLFGTGQDASIYYDGNNLIINPQEVGSGKLIIQHAGSPILVLNSTAGSNPAIELWRTGAPGRGDFRFVNDNGILKLQYCTDESSWSTVNWAAFNDGSSGYGTLNTGGNTVKIVALAVDKCALVCQVKASHTANLQEWWDVSSNVMSAINKLGNLILNNIKSGATQAAAGAGAGEVWKTSGHATLPDNVLMIGV